MSIYFEDYSINKVRRDATGAIACWDVYFGRVSSKWLNINLIKRIKC